MSARGADAGLAARMSLHAANPHRVPAGAAPMSDEADLDAATIDAVFENTAMLASVHRDGAD